MTYQTSTKDSTLASLTYSQSIPITGAYDVVVCGGGTAGTAAALAAARQGMTVLVLESQGQLGGTGTSGQVSHWLGGRDGHGKWVVGGIFRELSEQAAAEGIALVPHDTDPPSKYTPHGWLKGLLHGIPFDPHLMAGFLDRKMAADGVDVLLHTRVIDAVAEESRIRHIVFHNKSGLQAVNAAAVIDATGDADIAAMTGCGYDKGRDEDGAMTAVTLEVHVDNVDQDAYSDYVYEHDEPRMREFIKAKRAEGSWTQNADIFICVQLTENGVMMLNSTRVCGVDGTDGASVTEGTQRGRAEIEWLVNFLREHMPGFAGVRIKSIAPLLGVRETRRIHGEYRLTVEDLVSGRRFDDTIGLSSYGWDLADPKKPSLQPMHGKPKPPVTPIPYRIVVPRGIDNLACPGRSVSVEREVLGPLRVMAPVMAMGEAAGVAAAQVVRDGLAFRDVNTESLRAELARRGALLDWPVAG
jgi:glycine/D-amino acid oxidase-like deaminating enzyme